MFYHKRLLFTVLFAVTALVACEPDRSAEMQAEINRRIDRARKQSTTECASSTLRAAEALADSLLLAEAKATVHDSMRNKLPSKPLPPARVEPIDSLTVKPLF